MPNVSQKTLDAVVNYLARRPFAEVNQLLAELSNEVIPQLENAQKAAAKTNAFKEPFEGGIKSVEETLKAPKAEKPAKAPKAAKAANAKPTLKSV